MQHTLFTLRSSQSVVGPVITFLLCSFSTYTMELIPTNSSSGLEIIPNKLFVTTIGSQLDRQDRDVLRCVNKKYFDLVLSQDDLNKNYIKAYKKKDQEQMDYWKSLGGYFSYQELANAIKNKKYLLATWLFEQGRFSIWDVYCKNIEDAVATSTVDEMVPVIQWILNTRSPLAYDNEYVSAQRWANRFVAQYPEAQKFVDIFVKYQEDVIERQRQEAIDRIVIAQICSGRSTASCYGPVTGYYH